MKSSRERHRPETVRGRGKSGNDDDGGETNLFPSQDYRRGIMNRTGSVNETPWARDDWEASGYQIKGSTDSVPEQDSNEDGHTHLLLKSVLLFSN